MKEGGASKTTDFSFRNVHPSIFIGTASDRYAGWLGQIYSHERYKGRITQRTKKIGKKAFIEEVLPVESVREYFEHFRILELDFTFYGPLTDEKGRPGRNLPVLQTYTRYLEKNDSLILKVPQLVFAKKIWGKGGYADNPLYLNTDFFINRFYTPAVDLLGPSLAGFVFEQEYRRAKERVLPEEVADELGEFFAEIPTDTRYHVELRTESFLSHPVIGILEEFGVGQVFSHWTWLPSLLEQFSRGGRKFINADKTGIIRLMTPRGIRYEDAYARAHPFNSIVDGMMSTGMIEETVKLMKAAIREEAKITVIINNRAGGNAPLIAQKIMQQFLSSRDMRKGF